MIRSGRKPRDRSEQMILNNYCAMQNVREAAKGELTPDLVLRLHRIVTDGTLDDPDSAGRLRRDGEAVHVVDQYNEVLHTPPPAGQLEGRLRAMCDFANGKTPSHFIHPVVRAIALHFWLAYDHPFVDGNGRTARALFYWSMLSQGYWLCEFIAISPFLKNAPARYGRAFLYSETDENDMTYFALYHLELIRRAIEELHRYLARKAGELRRTESILRQSAHFNHRQLALLSHALRHSDARYSMRSHMTSHAVVYQTARTDLFDLADRGLLLRRKIGRTYYFSVPSDLEERLRDLA
jgi:Fic family protein